MNSSSKCIRIFISSTYEDLKPHRDHVRRLLDRLKESHNIEWVGMETFGVDDEPPIRVSLEKVRTSDVYLGIFGMRYGYIDRESGRSITELEYREAQRTRKPCMIYLIDEKSAQVAPAHVDTGESAVKLRDLKQELRDLTKGHVVGFFSDASDLAMQIATDLIRVLIMVPRTDELSGLHERVEQAILRCRRFILAMELLPQGGWAYHSAAVSAWDTAYSLLALAAAGEEGDTPTLHRGQQTLLSLRNRLGGWQSPWEQNPDASSTIDTAVALCALMESGYVEKPWEIERSIKYLFESRHSGEGWADTFGTSMTSTGATAWAVKALKRYGYSTEEPWAREAREWLVMTQQSDGGWSAGSHATHSTIGKTKDALMALWVLGLGSSEKTIERGRDWLISARSSDESPEAFGAKVGIEPQGINPGIESVIYFLEAAFYSGLPADNKFVRIDLDWLSGRRTWSHTPQGLWCLSQYRKWISSTLTSAPHPVPET
jgi:hypothetical protein